MKDKILIWPDEVSSITCLGDRLLDTMLLSTLAKLLNADLHFNWKDCPFTIGSIGEPMYHQRDGVFKKWDKVRYEDYRFENFTQYFNLPKNVKINEPINEPIAGISTRYHFWAGLGGMCSPKEFQMAYMTNLCSFTDFENFFSETMNEFTPTDKLLNLVKDFPKPYASVHLRRTDKISAIADNKTNIRYENLVDLNTRTQEAIDKLCKHEECIYISSDDQEEIDIYHNRYKNHIPHIKDCTQMEKTYIDLYIMANSQNIILSQLHSNFSVFASYINNANLIYLYDDCHIVEGKFKDSKNFIYYKDLV